jgi:hypothetical protein
MRFQLTISLSNFQGANKQVLQGHDAGSTLPGMNLFQNLAEGGTMIPPGGLSLLGPAFSSSKRRDLAPWLHSKLHDLNLNEQDMEAVIERLAQPE